MVILGGYPIEEGETNRTMKRKWKEIMSVASTSTHEVAPTRLPLAFGDNDLLDGKMNKYSPLLIRSTLGRLGAVACTVHLTMKFYSLTNEAITLNVDLESGHKCHYLSLKSK